MKEVFSIILWTIIGSAFTGAGTWVFLRILKPPIEANRILKNGTETTATLISIGSNVRISNSEDKKGKQYYSFKLSFVNSEGENVTVETNSIYPESFIKEMKIAEYNEATQKYDILTKETIQVIGLGNKAVVKGFVPNDKDRWWLWIISFAFFLTGATILISLIVGFVNVTAVSIIKRYGTTGMGIYSSHTYDTVALSATVYTIYFTFENAKGKTVVNKIVIPNNDVEAEMLVALRSFPVKFIGNKATIMWDKNEILQYYEQQILEKNLITQ